MQCARRHIRCCVVTHAITQMGGKGDFSDARIGVFIDSKVDLVTSKLPALREYQLSLLEPLPPAGSFDAARPPMVLGGPGSSGVVSRGRAGRCYQICWTCLPAFSQPAMPSVITRTFV